MGTEVVEDRVTILDVADTNIINKNIKRREDMLDVLFKGGTPENSKDMRLAKEIMESSDTALMQKASLRLKAQALNDNNDMNATVVEIIKQGAIRRAQGTRDVPIDVEITEEHVGDFTPVPGQLEMGHRKLELDDVLEKGTIAIDED